MTNIITACFGGTRFTNTRPAWLIDHGMVLQIKGVELPDVYEVDFSNSKAETATRVLGGPDGVVIPDQYFLNNAKQIYAWVYLTTGDSGFTTLQITIPLSQRPDVSTEPPTPQETDLIEQAIAALNDGVERAETAADDAEQSAEGVAESEANAAESARLAKLSEDNAKESEDNAAASERNASLSARAATASEEAAAASERNAESSATAADNSATAAGNAEEAAQAAQTGAEEAQRKAEDAQEAAEAAAQSIAQSAAQIAQNTSDIADLQDAVDTMQPAATASDVGKALIVKEVQDGKPTEYEYGEAGGGGDASNYAPIIINSASGDIASFADGADNMPVKQLTVNVEPIQDLHGYDSPWPAGASKNLIPNGTNTSNGYVNGQYLKNDGSLYSDVNWYTSEYFPVTAGETYTWSTNGNPNSPCICFYDSGKNYISSIQAAQELPKTFTAPSDAVYCRASQAKDFLNNGQQIELGSTATTPKPYSNICPISGRDNTTIYHSRHNMIDQNVVTQAPGWAASTDAGFTEYNGATVYKGVINSLFSTFRYYNQRIPVKVEPGKRYIISVWWRSVSASTANGLRIRMWYDDQTYTDSTNMTANQVWKRIALVSAAGKTLSGIGFQYNNTYQIYLAGFAVMDYDQYLAIGDGRDTFVCPNDRQSYTFQFGDTVYGATIDVTGGKMVVDRKIVEITTETTPASHRTNSYGYLQVIYRASFGIVNFSKVYCNAIRPTQATSIYNYQYANTVGISNLGQTPSIYVCPSAETTWETYNTWLDAIGTLQVVCVLATPIEITLTPTQIETLLGTNYIWSDAGPVDVEYRADTKLYIDNIHQPTDDDMTADAQIASGKYFLIGGNLYKSTTVIPAGDTIRPGTNCVKTNLAEALNALNT